MVTLGITHARGRTIAQPARSASKAGEALIVCGILSSLLYVATDILGGLRYEGYSFTSQTISELAAIGAPSRSFVDPLFITYDVLALAFGAGVVWAAAGRNRALRLTGAMLAAHAVAGLSATALEQLNIFSTSFAVPQRGVGTLVSGAPHLVLMGVIVLFLLLAIGFGAFALGRRFRVYSFATILTVIVSGALTSAFVTRVAADQPTPWLGVIERIQVYSLMLWLAVLSIALLRLGGRRSAPW
jgi:hypothetical protein